MGHLSWPGEQIWGTIGNSGGATPWVTCPGLGNKSGERVTCPGLGDKSGEQSVTLGVATPWVTCPGLRNKSGKQSVNQGGNPHGSPVLAWGTNLGNNR